MLYTRRLISGLVCLVKPEGKGKVVRACEERAVGVGVGAGLGVGAAEWERGWETEVDGKGSDYGGAGGLFIWRSGWWCWGEFCPCTFDGSVDELELFSSEGMFIGVEYHH
jgi:hypothetical protein